MPDQEPARSETPRTDAAARGLVGGVLHMNVPADFARQLERELAASERARVTLIDLHNEHCRAIADLEARLSATIAERDALEADLIQLRDELATNFKLWTDLNAALEAKLAEMERLDDYQHERVKAADAAIERLEAERDAALADAERYRFLRAGHEQFEVSATEMETDDPVWYVETGESLDAAIDAARASPGAGSRGMTDAMREEFEIYVRRTERYSHDFNFVMMNTGEYRSQLIECDWQRWQAAYAAGRRAGMEECERLCAAMVNGPRGFPAVSGDCADAIRALAKEEGCD